MAKRAAKPAGRASSAEPAPEAPVRYAPRPLGQVIGQPAALAVLRNALDSQRVHHAWIFHGPRGVGKFTTALAFAGALLEPSARPGKAGPGGGGADFEPSTEVGRLIASGAHPDLHVVTKELARFSDDRSVRDSKLITIPKDVVEKHLLIPAALAPTMRTGSRASKVFIVDEADLLDRSPFNAPVQNSILKMLEEPPEGTVIILVTESEDRLLATIRSRAQRVGFGRLDARAMDRWIEASGLEIPAAHRAWLVSHAAGSPGEFREAVEHRLYEWSEALTPLLRAVESRRFTVELGPAMASCAESWAESWVERHASASKDAANREGASRVLRMVGEHFRAGLARAGEVRPYLAAIEATARCERHVDSSVQIPLAMGNLAAQLSEAFAGR